jgi:ubiquinone/menaquinone biosynthesis C-methylase UbiE
VEKKSDLIPIPGNYQAEALVSRSPMQRGWHQSRVALFKKLFSFSSSDSVADIGCGSAIMINAIKNQVGKAYGIDSNPAAIEFGKEKFKHDKNVQIKLGQLDQTGLDPQSLNFILCTEVIEHVFDNQIDKIFQHWFEILKPGGEVFLTTPNEKSIWPLIEMTLDKLKLVPQMAGEQHVSHWTKTKLRETLEKNGFATIQVGTFNLFSPVGFALNKNLGDVLLGIEKSLLKSGGPLLWIKAKKHA